MGARPRALRDPSSAMAEFDSLHAPAAESAPDATGVTPASLFAAVKAAIGIEIPRHAARYLCEDETRVQSAMDLAIASVLHRFADRIATTDGAARLFGDLASKRLDGVVSAALERLVADEPDERGVRAAEHIMTRQFGRSVAPVAFRVAGETGVTAAGARELLILATPLVLAGLRDYAKAGGIDAAALRKRLAAEYPTAGRARRRARVLVLGVIVLVAGAALLALWRLVDPRTAPAAATVSEAPLPARSSGVDGLIEFLADPARDEYVFALDRVEFEPASATLKSGSNPQLAQVALALAAFPDARMTVRTRADGDSKEERAMAEKRALAVRAALAVFGLDLARTDHAGAETSDRPAHPVEARVTRR